MSEWINVEDKLPPENVNVRARTEDMWVNKWLRCCLVNNIWEVDPMEDECEERYPKITHWSPFPKRPNTNETTMNVEWGGTVRCMTSDGRCVNMADELNRLENDKSCSAPKPYPEGYENFKTAHTNPDLLDSMIKRYGNATLVSLSDVEEK